MDAMGKLTGVAQVKEQIMYSVFYIIAAVFLLIMSVPAYVPGLLVLGAVLYNVSKIGKTKYWFDDDSGTNKAIAVSYLIVIGAGVILALLYMLDVLPK